MECHPQPAKIRLLKALYSLFAFLLLTTWSQASLSLYMQIDEVAGENPDQAYSEWLDITSVSRGGSNAINLSGSLPSASRYTPNAIHISMQFPAGYDKLANYITAGTARTISIHVVQSGTKDSVAIQTYIFHDSYISNLTTEAESGGILTATLSFAYSRMEWEVTGVNDQGKPKVSGSLDFDFTKNTITSNVPGSGGGGGGSTDNDSDNIPNTWETTYGLNPNSAADRNADPDLDGFSNYLEFLCGTHPKNFTSHLKIITLTQANGETSASLEWSSVSGKSYLVQRAVNGLNSPDWVTLATVPASSGSSTTYSLPSVEGNNVFYRVILVK